MFNEIGAEGFQRYSLRVLGGDHNRVHADRLVPVIADGDLGLSIGAEVAQRAVLADIGKLLGQPVGQPDGRRHQHRCLVAGIAEHDSLVSGTLRIIRIGAGALTRLQGGEDTGRDLGRLLPDGHRNTAACAVEAVCR